MLTVYLGNLGSSKTTCAVRDMVIDNSGLPIHTNIVTSKIPGVTLHKNKELLKTTIDDSGKKPKEKIVFNRDYWLGLKKPMSIYWDEFHFVADSRDSMTASNKACTEFISMARRIIGFDQYGYPDFVMICQKLGTLDVRIRELVTTIVYHVLNFLHTCEECEYVKWYSSEKPNLKLCPWCQQRSLVKSDYYSTRFFFKDETSFNEWFYNGEKTYHSKLYIPDIASYWSYFDTLQYIKAQKD